MRKSTFAASAVLFMSIGIAAGFLLDPESTPATQAPIAAPQHSTPTPTPSSATPQAPSKAPSTPPQASPARPVVLDAINLMKPDFKGQVSDEARKLYNQLKSAGYYYWVTYPNGAERINRDYSQNGMTYSVEFAVAPNGTQMDASRWGVSTTTWGVNCASAPGQLTFDSFNELKAKTNNAATAMHFDKTCTYDRY